MVPDVTFRSGQLATTTGVSPDTIRHYERIGVDRNAAVGYLAAASLRCCRFRTRGKDADRLSLRMSGYCVADAPRTI